jgi:hypothetical protein
MAELARPHRDDATMGVAAHARIVTRAARNAPDVSSAPSTS